MTLISIKKETLVDNLPFKDCLTMNDQDKSKEQLINELQELKVAHNSLKATFEANLLSHKIAEEALQDSEKRFRNVLQDIKTVAVQGYAPDGTTTYWNKASEKLYGFTAQEALGSNILDLIIPFEMKDNVSNAIKSMAESGQPIPSSELLLKRKDGSLVPVFSHHTIVQVAGQPQELFCIDIDLTDSKQVENKLKESEQRYRNLFDQANEGLILLTMDGKIAELNNSFAQMHGYTVEEMKNMNIKDLDVLREHAFDGRDAVMQRLYNGEVVRFEVEHFHKNGHSFFMSDTASLITIAGQQYFLAFHRDITERKQNEEKLIKSQERYALVIDASEQGIWDWNVETNEVFYSEQWKKQIGYKDHELENEFRTWVEHLHPDEREYCQNAIHSYLEHPVEHFILNFRFRHKDGTYRWIHSKAASLKNTEGRVIRLFGTHTDITESKVSEAIFKDIIEKNPISIQILDMEGYQIQVNSAHTKLFGVEPPSDYSVFKDTQLLSLGFDNLFEQIKKGEVVYFPDSYYNVHDVDPSFPDSPAWVKALGFTLNDNNGNPSKIVLMHENVTESKNAEALLNDIIENNPMSIQIVDINGHTIRCNPAFIELFGSVPPPEFSIFDDLSNKSAELGNLISRVKNGGMVHLPDLYFNAHDAVEEVPDIPLWIRALIFPLKDSAGKPRRFVFMHENITERKIAEQELIKAKEKAEESDKLKSAFLANMSHEIRTPMNGILGFTDLLSEPDLGNEKQQEYIEIIQKNGERMLNIINDIVSISKIESGIMNIHLTETNISNQLQFVYDSLKLDANNKKLNLSFSCALSEKQSIIKTDTEKFFGILSNLVKNAIKYTKTGSIEFGYINKGEEFEFFVKDTGIGIAKEMQEAIFQRFIQADIGDKMARKGAGLGLSIAKAYVELLGGKIWVKSEVNVGSTFYFTLPYKRAE